LEVGSRRDPRAEFDGDSDGAVGRRSLYVREEPEEEAWKSCAGQLEASRAASESMLKRMKRLKGELGPSFGVAKEEGES